MVKVKTKSKTEDKLVKQIKDLKLSDKKQDRPTFYVDGDKGKPIRAGGVILYRITNKVELLMIRSCWKDPQGKYEDFGGCTDPSDTSIEDTIGREAFEESNEILDWLEIMNSLSKVRGEGIYIPRSKYILYFLKTDENYKPEDFGDREIHDDIERTVEWVDISNFGKGNFNKTKLHWRLICREFFQKIAELKSLLTP